MIENLVGTNLFAKISPSEIEKMLVCSKSYKKTYKKGEYIFYQGEKPEKIYLLLEGYVYIAKDFASGKRDVLYTIEEGNVFGEMFLFADMEQYWYDAVAAKDVTVLEIPWDFFYHFCQNACTHHQTLVKNMLEILSKKEFHITKKLHIISTASVRERIAIWLIDSMDEKGIVKLQMKREELADFLGVARPSLSRELMRMQTEGLIQVEKKQIQLLDMEAMEILYT